MQNFLRKISEKNFDESVHYEFIKYSKGEFNERYLIEAKRGKNNWTIKTSAEFANFLVSMCLEKAPEKIEVKGILISTFDLTQDAVFKVKEVKKYMGIQKTIVDGEVERDKLKEFMEKYPRVFYALSFETADATLKIKQKPPKSPKPSSKGSADLKADFCTLKTKDENVVKDLIFDVPEFKEVKIHHNLKIDKIEIPKDVEDPKKMRELAKRGGRIERVVDADGKEIRKDMEFLA